MGYFFVPEPMRVDGRRGHGDVPLGKLLPRPLSLGVGSSGRYRRRLMLTGC